MLQVRDEMLKIPDFTPKCSGALWDSDTQERNVFIVFDDTNITTYLYDKDSVQGLYAILSKVQLYEEQSIISGTGAAIWSKTNFRPTGHNHS
jgi:hypothetical protein